MEFHPECYCSWHP